MEDILASIRKILSEDDGAAAKPEPAQPAPEPPPEPPPPAPLPPEPMMEPEPVASIFDAEPEAEPVFHAVEPEPEPEDEAPLQLTDSMMVQEPAYQPQPEPMPSFAPQGYDQDYGDGLVSAAAAAASGASIAQLAHAVARERAVALGNQGITLEQLIREICTPLLKQWLDSNLPYMVERIVKQEIERIADRSDRT